MDDLSDMTLDKFKLWSSSALKVYLSRRKKVVDGSFDELTARAFCAWEENIPVDATAEQNEVRLLNEYKKKLTVDCDVVQDPFSLSTGWKGEKTGMEMWPPVYITDIAKYLNCNTPGDVVNRVLNEYKEGKAYRYFDCGWVKEVFMHDIRKNSDKCFLKAKVTPSQSVNNKNYDTWILVRKKGVDQIGGEILSGYCSCTAGMYGSCNHIAGVLFRVEHAVKTGLTSTACTAKPCQWNVPKNKTIVKPVKVASVSWRKSDYLNRKKLTAEEDAAKSNFTPLSKAQSHEVKNQEHMRQRLYDLMKDDIPNSVFMLSKEKKRPKANINACTSQPTELPQPITRLAVKVNEMDLPEGEKRSVFIKLLKVTPKEIRSVNNATVEQSTSGLWREQRKGRVTASNFQRVCSRVKTLRKDVTGDASSLVSAIIGLRDVKQTLAMKHGLSMEPFAKKSYCHIMKKKHKKFLSKDSGLTIDQDVPYIAASADLEVECLCCGKGLCEVKCPDSIKGSIPSEENVPYIKKNDNEYVLDTKHPYYYQIQGQMGVLGRQYCDLFVYTSHGSITTRINFDEQFWQEVRSKLMWFWNTYVLNELLTSNNNKENQPTSAAQTLPPPSATASKTPVTKQCPPVTKQCSSVTKQCPPVTKQCPPVTKQCSPVTKQCPPMTKQCPPVTKQCPPVTKRCPPVTKQCSPVMKQCSPVTKQCPPVTKQCPPVTKLCPPLTKQCPPLTKPCPPVNSQCSNVSKQNSPGNSQCSLLAKLVLPKVNKARRALNPLSPNKSNKRRKNIQTKKPVYLCGTCGLDCVDEPQTDAEQSVNCDLCNSWVHYICADVDDEVCDMQEWICSRCK